MVDKSRIRTTKKDSIKELKDRELEDRTPTEDEIEFRQVDPEPATEEEVEKELNSDGWEDEEDEPLLTEQDSNAVVVSKVYGVDGKLQENKKELSIVSTENMKAKVGILISRTIPLEPYENMKVSIYVTVPSYVEEIEEAYKFVSKFAHEALEKEEKLVSSLSQNSYKYNQDLNVETKFVTTTKSEDKIDKEIEENSTDDTWDDWDEY